MTDNMQVMTIKAKPRVLFGAALAVTGLIVILLTFIGNHNGVDEKAVMADISCNTTQERIAYLKSLGWETDGTEAQKQVTIPSEFNKVYEDYNEIQLQQGFDLTRYKGQTVDFYTYNITNSKENENLTANMLICGGVLVGADLCDPSAEDGFLIALIKNDGKN